MQIIYFDFDEYTLSEVSLNTLKTFLDKKNIAAWKASIHDQPIRNVNPRI